MGRKAAGCMSPKGTESAPTGDRGITRCCGGGECICQQANSKLVALIMFYMRITLSREYFSRFDFVVFAHQNN